MSDAILANMAVIGLGMATRPHLEALAELEGRVAVAGVFNRTRARAEDVQRRFGFPVIDSLADLAGDAAIDGVILATPPNQRLEIVRALAAAGKHILMEKPVERTLGAAREIVEICEASGVRLGIVFQNRFRAGALHLRRLTDAGALGELTLVRATVPWWRDQAYYDAPGRGTLERDGGGVLLSQAIHLLDLMLSLTGPAAQVQAMCATTAQHRMETEDFATAGIRFASGAVGSVVTTTASWPGGEESLVIDGTEGTATLAGGTLRICWRDGREEVVESVAGTGGGADPMAFPCDWHRDLIEDFARAVAEDHAPAITGREALGVHALIDAIVRSSDTGRIVEVERV